MSRTGRASPMLCPSARPHSRAARLHFARARSRALRHALPALFLLIALLGCGARARAPVAATPTPAAVQHPPAAARAGFSRPADVAERSLVDQLMRETEQLRGLRFRAPVEVTIEDQAAMRAYVNRALKEEQLRRARDRYLALGVLDPALDVRGLLVSVMEEELIGYYDPVEKRLAVRTDIARALELGEERSDRSLVWRATVVHELVHALQDQYFALGEAIDQTRTTDADNAFGALVEGDASLVMLAYTAKLAGESLASVAAQPERVLSALSRAPEQLTGALRRAPALLREPLLFRYREGARFCAELFRAGGWARIDAAHRDPPTSTWAIRDAQHYLARRAQPALTLPDLSWLAAHDVVKLDEDVLGGLELSVVLGAAGIEADYLVSAWRGDRYAVLRQRGITASLWWIRFATAATARSVEQAFAELGDPSRQVLRQGPLVIVARGLDPATVAELERRVRSPNEPERPRRGDTSWSAPSRLGGRDRPPDPDGARQEPESSQTGRRVPTSRGVSATAIRLPRLRRGTR